MEHRQDILQRNISYLTEDAALIDKSFLKGVCIEIELYKSAHACVCVYVCMCICVYVCAYIYIYIYIYLSVSVCRMCIVEIVVGIVLYLYNH